MFTALRNASLVLASLAAAGHAQSIDTVEPASGSIGTLITITGSDFGTAKPKVWLSQEGSKKKRRLKVTSSSDVEIIAELKKGEIGDFDVNVQPKGKGALIATEEEGFEIPLPTFDTLDPVGAELAPGTAAVLGGVDFGSRKPRLKVGGKKAKVTAFSDDEITFVIPKALHDGAHDLEFRNPVTTLPIPALVSVTGSTKTIGKPDTATYKADKKKFTIGGFLAMIVASDVDSTTISLSQGGFPSYQLTLDIPVASLDESVPVAFIGSPDASITMTYTAELFGASTTWVSGDDLDEVIKIQSIKDGVATVEFSGELTRTAGTFGKPTMSISQGIASPTGQ